MTFNPSTFAREALQRTSASGMFQLDKFTANQWIRVERDLQADITTLWPGKTLSTITGVYVWSGPTGNTLRMDDLAFSNSLTAEHNTFGPGAVGHLLRQRVIHPTTFAATDRWFHYDQVGSVLSESDASGALAQTHHQDAFGNTQASWSTGLWGGDRAGWHHNTKELDGDTGLVYTYQRWYLPEVGVFASSAPFRITVEQRYSFSDSDSVNSLDPDGRRAFRINDNAIVVGAAGGFEFTFPFQVGDPPPNHQGLDAASGKAGKQCKGEAGTGCRQAPGGKGQAYGDYMKRHGF